jgi:pimeloyl-ACP methyl ester carboxylesterase
MTLRTHLDGAVFAEHLPGRSPTILALHGWGRDRSDLLDALSGREVVAPDLPGFGVSPPPPEPWGAARYADLVSQFVEQAELGPVIVVGHSFGGRVAAHLAADHPDLVSGVVFVGAPLLRTTPTTKPARSYRLVRQLRRMQLVSESMLDSMRQRHGSADYRAATGVMRDVLVTVVNEDYSDELSRITCPVGFCWGATDTAVRPDIATGASALVSRSVVVDVVDGAGHDVHRSHPDRLVAVIDAVTGAVEVAP